MSFDTFPYEYYPPTYGAEENISDAILEARFGDGYGQSTPDGINYKKSAWNLMWENHPLYHAGLIWDFLRPKVRLIPFFWKTPDMPELVQVRCTELKRSWPKYGVRTVTATFVTNYDL